MLRQNCHFFPLVSPVLLCRLVLNIIFLYGNWKIYFSMRLFRHTYPFISLFSGVECNCGMELWDGAVGYNRCLQL